MKMFGLLLEASSHAHMRSSQYVKIATSVLDIIWLRFVVCKCIMVQVSSLIDEIEAVPFRLQHVLDYIQLLSSPFRNLDFTTAPRFKKQLRLKPFVSLCHQGTAWATPYFRRTTWRNDSRFRSSMMLNHGTGDSLGLMPRLISVQSMYYQYSAADTSTQGAIS